MTAIWVESLGRTFDQALDLLAAAVRDYTDVKLTRFHGHLGYGIVARTTGGSMKRSRKPYPAEFKQEAIRLLREQQLPRSQVARDLGVDPETLRRWARDLAPDSQLSQDSTTTPPVSAAESPGCAVKTSNCAWSATS